MIASIFALAGLKLVTGDGSEPTDFSAQTAPSAYNGVSTSPIPNRDDAKSMTFIEASADCQMR